MIPAYKIIASMGSIPKVNGRIRAIPVMGLNPGRAPKVIPRIAPSNIIPMAMGLARTLIASDKASNVPNLYYPHLNPGY